MKFAAVRGELGTAIQGLAVPLFFIPPAHLTLSDGPAAPLFGRKIVRPGDFRSPGVCAIFSSTWLDHSALLDGRRARAAESC